MIVKSELSAGTIRHEEIVNGGYEFEDRSLEESRAGRPHGIVDRAE